VENLALISADETYLSPIVDVLDVPLDQLPGDPGARLMVDAIKGKLTDPSSIPVAAFNSAI
jgi:hypothetical protein